MKNSPTSSPSSIDASSNWLATTQNGWAREHITPELGPKVAAEWVGHAHGQQYPAGGAPACWLVTGGRGSGKTRLGAEWVNALARGLPPFSPDGYRYGNFALVGETLADVREVMIDGPSGILATARGTRPRYEPSRKRLVWPDGRVAHVFSSEDPESLRGPQPDAEILPGALVRLPEADADYLVTEIEDGLVRHVIARQVVRTAPTAWQSANRGAVAEPPMIVGQPLAVFADLPLGIGTGSPEEQFRVAAWQRPWKSQVVFASPEDSGFAQRATLARPADIGTLVEALAPGVVGRPDHSAVITVELNSGAFSSVSRALLLNGANTIAVRAANGAWEVIQFETAEEIAPDTWRLRSLLRGQLGTEDATAAGAETGAYLLVLDERVQPAGLLASETSLLLNWRVGPAGADLSEASFSAHSEIGGLRALLPLAPVHLRSTGEDNGVMLSWVRRGRVDADNWIARDIPLGEEREEYQVEIALAGGAIVRTATASAQSLLYGSAEIAADFGTPPAEIDVTVRQLSLSAGWGLPATRRLSLS